MFWYTDRPEQGCWPLPSTDNDVFTSTPEDTDIRDNSGLAVGSGNGSSAATNLTINVHGTIDLSQPTLR